ncbi:Sua5/YciO/YrdC/YwlC family protein [Sulfurimonas sp. C5]|uniref:Sua5/YciO/YrdC/YwlC family protein n=1 Tax=Sulfurimonas sp. C5 TaxID=3036947 RepID=UPI0024564685|nr:Sua5/YciO/YrdC/YwlC family protein [Sulfurimonas sp. C5]MDH4943499.1 Sua5/YciO/YrdC/YwlC family protein [Sulfurimonas sp. C5]
MVKSNSTTRLFSINEQVILTQTDTTVGFVSQNANALADIKTRPNSKPFIKVYNSLKSLQDAHKRVPKTQKRLLRRANKSTFIVKNEAFRIAAYPLHSNILRNLNWVYSTSANESGKNFDREFCQSKTDIIIEDLNDLEEKTASKLFKINNKKIKRLR